MSGSSAAAGPARPRALQSGEVDEEWRSHIRRYHSQYAAAAAEEFQPLPPRMTRSLDRSESSVEEPESTIRRWKGGPAFKTFKCGRVKPK